MQIWQPPRNTKAPGMLSAPGFGTVGSNPDSRFISVVTITAKLSAELHAVLAAQITESVLVNVTLGRVNILAPNAEEWRYKIMTAEAHGWETVIRNSWDS